MLDTRMMSENRSRNLRAGSRNRYSFYAFSNTVASILARVAEQVDAHGSGPCALAGMGVRLPPRAQNPGNAGVFGCRVIAHLMSVGQSISQCVC